MTFQVSHVATAEKALAPNSKAQPAMVPTPKPPIKKGIPKAPTASASSAAMPAPAKQQQRLPRNITRLPAAPAGGDSDVGSKRQAGPAAGAGKSLATSGADLASSKGEPKLMCEARDCDDTAALQRPYAAITCPPPSSSTAGPQQPVEEQSCGCSGCEGLSTTTSDTYTPDLLCSASSSFCCDGPSSSLSASSSCSLSSSSSSSAAAASDSPSSPASGSPASSALSSSAERPTSLPINQVEQEPRTAASDDTEPPCCCPTTSTSIATTTANATTTTATASIATPTTTTTTTSPSRVRFFVASPGDPTPPAVLALSPAEARRIANKLGEMYGDFNIRLIDALLPPPRESCAPVAAPASPRLTPTAESAEEEACPAAPSEETAQPSKAPKRKLSKFLRGLFGGCVGRNVEAL